VQDAQQRLPVARAYHFDRAGQLVCTGTGHPESAPAAHVEERVIGLKIGSVKDAIAEPRQAS
jgi:hypothetical protein